MGTTAVLSPRANEVVLIDKIDHVLIDMVTRLVNNQEPQKKKNVESIPLQNKIVGFTATKEAVFSGAEIEFIKHYHGFKFVDSMIY